MKKLRFKITFKGIPIICDFLVIILTLDRFRYVCILPFTIYGNKHVKNNKSVSNKTHIKTIQKIECGLAGMFFIVPSWFFSLILGFDLGLVYFVPALFLYHYIFIISYLYYRIKGYSDLRSRSFVCFNREAYVHSNSDYYFILRKPFAWTRYLFASHL
jgi:hypothetical protein